MVVGNFNYHQILFALDTFNLEEDKIGYLEKIVTELSRIVECFEAPKALPLKMYASKNISIESSCNELRDFINKQFEIITTNPYDKRYPGEGQLRGLVRAELMNYKKIQSIVTGEINDIIEKNRAEAEVRMKEKSFIQPKKTTPNHISKLLKTEYGKIIWDSSIGELIDLIKVIIILEINPGLTEQKIAKLISERFVNSEKQNFLPSQVEKVQLMLQSTFWLNSKSSSPKYFQ